MDTKPGPACRLTQLRKPDKVPNAGQSSTARRRVALAFARRGLSEPVDSRVDIAKQQTARPEIAQEERRLGIMRNHSDASLKVGERCLRQSAIDGVSSGC